jgi:hypothetical protein
MHTTNLTYTELSIAGGGDALLISKYLISLVKMSYTLVKTGVTPFRTAQEPESPFSRPS